MALGTVELVVETVGMREIKSFLWEKEQSV